MVGDDFNLSWVHLSDLHFKQNSLVNQDLRLILDSLINDVSFIRTKLGGTPEFLFITGDIAYSGNGESTEEYDNALKWLAGDDMKKGYISELGTEKKRIYFVPGNHDINRKFLSKPNEMKAAKNLYDDILRKNPYKLDDYFGTAEFYSHIWPKLKNYFKFIDTSFPNLKINKEVCYVEKFREYQGKQIKLIGLNTNLLSFDNNDSPKNMALGKKQILDALSDETEDGNNLHIVLQHHPPEWLADKRYLYNRIAKKPHILFCGHTHTPEVPVTFYLGQGGYIRFTGGAVYEEENKESKSFTYYFGKLTNKGIFYWPRIWSQSRGEFRGNKEFFDINEDDCVFHPAEKLPGPLVFWLTGKKSPTDNTRQGQQPESKTELEKTELEKIEHIEKIVGALNNRRGRTNKSEILCANDEVQGCELETNSIGLGRKVQESDRQSHKIALIINELDEILKVMHDVKNGVGRSNLLKKRIQKFYRRTYDCIKFGKPHNTKFVDIKVEEVNEELEQFFAEEIRMSNIRMYDVSELLAFFDNACSSNTFDIFGNLPRNIDVTQGILNELITKFEQNMSKSSLKIEEIIRKYKKPNTASILVTGNNKSSNKQNEGTPLK